MIVARAIVGTGVPLFPVLKRQNEGVALGFVDARLFETGIIVVGSISLLSVVTLRRDLGATTGADAAALVTTGQALVALQDWTFLIRQGLMPGLLSLPHVLPHLDSDGGQQIADAEGRAYVDSVLRQLMLHLDRQPLVLTVTEIDMPPYLNIQLRYGTIRVFAVATRPADMTGTHTLDYENKYAPTGAAHQVNAFGDVTIQVPFARGGGDFPHQEGICLQSYCHPSKHLAR